MLLSRSPRKDHLHDVWQHHVHLIESRYSKVVRVCEVLRLSPSPRGSPRGTLSFHYVSMLYPDCRLGPCLKIKFGTLVALLPRHFTSGYQQTFPQVASSRLYYARHTRGTRQPLSGRELPIFLAITRACKPELAEYVRRFLTPTSPFYAVVPEGRMLTSPLLREKFFHPRPLLSFYPSLSSSFARIGFLFFRLL